MLFHGQSYDGNGNRRHRPLRASQAGILLAECLVYIGVFAVITGVAFGTFIQCMTNSRDLRRAAEDIERALKAGERWREDVRSATGPITVEQQSGEPLVKIPQAIGLVEFRFSQGTIQRKASNHDTPVVLLDSVKDSTMEPDVRQSIVAWRWELELQSRQKVVRLRPLFTFTAVPPKRESK